MYAADSGVYPPGDGTGSSGLILCLQRKSPKGAVYFNFSPDMFFERDLRNPVWPDAPWPRNVIFYRHPGLHNRGTVDLWCEDLEGRPDGINTWD